MTTNKSSKAAKPMAKKSMKKAKGGAWYAKFDGVDGSVQSDDRPAEQMSLNFTKIKF